MLLTLKTKNQLKKAMSNQGLSLDLEYHISQKTEDGKKIGCLGFVKNRTNNKTVFLSTTFKNKVMYKAVRYLKDYKGGCTRWATEDDFAHRVIDMLR